MPFDTRDWLRCPELKVLSPDIRGLWMDMLCYMWESPVKGVMVKPNGIIYTQAEIVAMLGNDAKGSSAWLNQLIEAGVCGVREDGAIFSRRMVRENELSRKRAIAGQKGGMSTSNRSERSGASEKARGGKKVTKIEFAEFVHLTQKEYDALIAKYGQKQTAWMIQKLDNTKGSNTKKYQYTSDYRAILKWVVGAYEETIKNGTNNNRSVVSGPSEADRYNIGTTL